jgi:hypothetical protein
MKERDWCITAIICFAILGCKPVCKSSMEGTSYSTHYKQEDSFPQIWRGIDTCRIAILPYDSANYFSLEHFTKDSLTNKDLLDIEILLDKCIWAFNSKQDTSKAYSQFIYFRKYKCQYVAFVNSKGKRKVFVNCFCAYPGEFKDWRHRLVRVMDGGIYFFNVIINLTAHKYETLYPNGEA